MDFLLNFSNVQIWRELYNVCFWSLGAQMSGWPPTCPDFSASEAALFLLIYLKSATFSNIQKRSWKQKMSFSLASECILPKHLSILLNSSDMTSITVNSWCLFKDAELRNMFSFSAPEYTYISSPAAFFLFLYLNSASFIDVQQYKTSAHVCLWSECSNYWGARACSLLSGPEHISASSNLSKNFSTSSNVQRVHAQYHLCLASECSKS